MNRRIKWTYILGLRRGVEPTCLDNISQFEASQKFMVLLRFERLADPEVVALLSVDADYFTATSSLWSTQFMRWSWELRLILIMI